MDHNQISPTETEPIISTTTTQPDLSSLSLGASTETTITKSSADVGLQTKTIEKAMTDSDWLSLEDDLVISQGSLLPTHRKKLPVFNLLASGEDITKTTSENQTLSKNLQCPVANQNSPQLPLQESSSKTTSQNQKLSENLQYLDADQTSPKVPLQDIPNVADQSPIPQDEFPTLTSKKQSKREMRNSHLSNSTTTTHGSLPSV